MDRANIGRHVDNDCEMEKEQNSHGNRQIIGFSLSPKTAQEVKTEATRRKISLRKLFEEMWQDYQVIKK